MNWKQSGKRWMIQSWWGQCWNDSQSSEHHSSKESWHVRSSLIGWSCGMTIGRTSRWRSLWRSSQEWWGGSFSCRERKEGKDQEEQGWRSIFTWEEGPRESQVLYMSSVWALCRGECSNKKKKARNRTQAKVVASAKAQVDVFSKKFEEEFLLISQHYLGTMQVGAWLIDSGATCHMTEACELFESFT